MTPGELAARTGTHERYVREWLNAQAAAGYVDVRRRRPSATRCLPSRRSRSPTRTARPACSARSRLRQRHRARRGRRSPRRSAAASGVGWHEHSPACSTAPSASSGPATTRTSSTRGSRRSTASRRSSSAARRVADVGCGHGASTILMAKAFPSSTFVGFDYHEPSIEAARERAAAAGVADRVRFEVAAAKDFPGTGYDLVAVLRLPARHGRPGRRRAPRARVARARRHVADRRAVRRRPRRGQPEPGRPRLLLGLDAGLHAGLALAGGRPGARRAGRRGAPRARSSRAAGFTRFRRATETPFNLVLEARRRPDRAAAGAAAAVVGVSLDIARGSSPGGVQGLPSRMPRSDHRRLPSAVHSASADVPVPAPRRRARAAGAIDRGRVRHRQGARRRRPGRHREPPQPARGSRLGRFHRAVPLHPAARPRRDRGRPDQGRQHQARAVHGGVHAPYQHRVHELLHPRRVPSPLLGGHLEPAGRGSQGQGVRAAAAERFRRRRRSRRRPATRRRRGPPRTGRPRRRSRARAWRRGSSISRAP